MTEVPSRGGAFPGSLGSERRRCTEGRAGMSGNSGRGAGVNSLSKTAPVKREWLASAVVVTARAGAEAPSKEEVLDQRLELALERHNAEKGPDAQHPAGDARRLICSGVKTGRRRFEPRPRHLRSLPHRPRPCVGGAGLTSEVLRMLTRGQSPHVLGVGAGSSSRRWEATI